MLIEKTKIVDVTFFEKNMPNLSQNWATFLVIKLFFALEYGPKTENEFFSSTKKNTDTRVLVRAACVLLLRLICALLPSMNVWFMKAKVVVLCFIVRKP